jgi:hypothetical protein
MIKVTAKLKSVTPYSQSRHIEEPDIPKESAVARELRLWHKRMHVTKDGKVFIPMMQFTKAVLEAAVYLSLPVEGKKQKTLTKHFITSVRCVTDLVTKWSAKDIQPEELFVPSNGKRGGGSRVTKYFPLIPSWEGTITFIVADETITQSAFEMVIRCAGALIGIGRFRPKNEGSYGMFEVLEIKWHSGDHKLQLA